MRFIGRSAPALPRARLRAMMGASIVGLIGRERCAGGLPLSTILTGARAQGRDALCSGGCATFGDRASLRCRKRKSCHFLPRRRHASTEKPTSRFPKQPDPGRTHHGRTSEGLVTSPHDSSRFICLAPPIVEEIVDGQQPKGLRLAGLVLASKAARDIPSSQLARGGKQ
jgi:hypothetical protein